MFNTNLKDLADNVALLESKLRLTAPDDKSAWEAITIRER